MKQRFLSQNNTGNALLEYALPAGLIVITLVAALVTVPAILQDWFANTMNGSVGSNSISVAALGQPVLTAQIRNRIDMLPPLKAGEEQVCTPNFCVNLPVIQSNAMIETAGGNGNELVTKLSIALEQLIVQLKQENADASLIALIEQLANEGHSLADVMAMLKQQKELEAQQLAQEQAKQKALDALNAQNTSTVDPAKMKQIATQSIKNRAINWGQSGLSVFDPAIGKIVPIQNVLNGDPVGFYESGLIQQINAFNSPTPLQIQFGMQAANIKDYTELAQYLEAQAQRNYYPSAINPTYLKNQTLITQLTGKTTAQRYNEYIAVTVQPILDFIAAKGNGNLNPQLVAQIKAAQQQFAIEQAKRLAAAQEAERVRTSINTSTFSNVRSQLDSFLSQRPALASQFADVKTLIDASANSIETISTGASTNQNITLNEVTQSVNTTHKDSNGICTASYRSYRCMRRQYKNRWSY